MGFSGSTYNRIYSWVTDFQTGGDALYIDAEKMDEEFDEIKGGLESLLLLDGSNSPSQNINWGNNKITSLGAPTAGSDAARYTEVLLGLGKYATTTYTLSSDTITPTQAIFKIDTESAASTDDVDTITASSFATGSVIIVSAANAARDVVLKNGTGNLENYNNEDITLTDIDQFVMYHYDGTNWEEMWRSRSLTYSEGITSTSAGTLLTVTSTDATSASGPTIDLHRDSASPADDDFIGSLVFSGESDDDSKKTYARILGQIDDANAATNEDGKLYMQLLVADTITTRLTLDSAGVDVSGTFDVSGVANFAAAVTMDTTLGVTGNLTTNGILYVDESGADADLYLRSDKSTDLQTCARIVFQGHDDGGTDTTYARIDCFVDDNTNTTENGRLTIRTMKDGSLTQAWHFDGQGGMFAQGLTTQGNGTINAAAFYDNGVGPLSDYVFEYYTTGKIDLGEYDELAYTKTHGPAHAFMNERADWIYDLDAFADFWKRNHHLPNWPGKHLSERTGIGEQVQKLVEVVETQAIHIDKLHQRVKELER